MCMPGVGPASRNSSCRGHGRCFPHCFCSTPHRIVNGTSVSHFFPGTPVLCVCSYILSGDKHGEPTACVLSFILDVLLQAKESFAAQQPPAVRILKHLLWIDSPADRRKAMDEAFTPGAELATSTQDFLTTCSPVSDYPPLLGHPTVVLAAATQDGEYVYNYERGQGGRVQGGGAPWTRPIPPGLLTKSTQDVLTT